MKFIYGYKTSDNERREDVIRAASRDAAYAALKRDGIRPFSVELAPGFFNRLSAIGKRWFAIAALAVLAAVLAFALKRERVETDILLSQFADKTRRQVIGDAAVIDKGVRTGWADVFSKEGDRFLASFAIPGVAAGVKTTSENALKDALKNTVRPSETDPIEVRQIKALVEGMKDELRQYLADGGSIVEYGRAVVARQEEELGYYNRAKAELEAVAKELSEDELEELWEKRNSSLRRMGIRLIPMPE